MPIRLRYASFAGAIRNLSLTWSASFIPLIVPMSESNNKGRTKGLAVTPSFCLQSRVSDPTPSFSDRDAGLPIGEPSAYAPPFRLLLSVRSLASVRKSGLTTTDCPVSLFPIYGLQKAVQVKQWSTSRL